MWFRVCSWSFRNFILSKKLDIRGRSTTAATSKMEHFVIIVNGWKLLTIITQSSILDVAVALEPPLIISTNLLFQLTIRNFTHVPVVTTTKERWTQILAVKLTKQSNKKYSSNFSMILEATYVASFDSDSLSLILGFCEMLW